MSKKKKKWILIGKILLWIVIFFFLVVPSLLFFAVQTTTVQNRLIPIIEESVAELLGTKVKIGSLEYRFLLSIQLNDITIEDLQQQKLLRVKHCLVDIDKLDIFLRLLTIKEILLTEPEVLLYRNKQQDSIRTNIDFLVTKFSQPSQKTTTSEKGFFSIKLNDFSIQDLSVRWIDSIEGKDLLMKDIDVELRKIAMRRDDELTFSLQNFSCNDILGLSIRSFSANVFVRADSIGIADARIADRFSKLALNISAARKHKQISTDWKDWNVVLTLLQHNYLDSRSLHFFLPNIPHVVVNSLSGEIQKNNQEIIISSPLTFSIFDNIKGSIEGKVNNISNVNNISGHLVLQHIEGKGEHFNNLLDSVRRVVTIPHQIELEKDLHFALQGNYQFEIKNGMLHDFYGTSNLGYSSDNYLSLYVMAKEDSLYKDRLHTRIESTQQCFPLSTLISQLPIDVADAQLTTTGYLNTLNYKESKISVIGMFDNVIVGKEKYSNIDIDCHLNNQQIDISVESFDKRLKGKLTGYYHLLTERVLYNLDLKNLDLSQFFKSDSTHQVACKSYGNFTVNTLDTINGTFYLTNIFYNNKAIDSLQFELKSRRDIFGVYLHSKSISAEITGKKHIAEAIPTIEYVAKRYLSYTTERMNVQNVSTDSSNYYRFRLTLHNNKWLRSIIPSLHTDGETVITGYLNTPESPFKCNINIPAFTYNNYLFSNTTLDATLVDTLLLISIQNDQIQSNDNVLLRKIKAKGNFRAGRLNSKITFIETVNHKESLLSFRFILPHSHYNKTSKYIVEIDSSDVYLSQREFQIHNSQIAFDSTELQIDNFAVTSKDFSLSGNGKYSEDKNDTLTFTFRNFDIALLNNPSKEIQVKGVVNGAMRISHVTQNHNNITGQIECRQFRLNDYQVGDVLFSSTYLPQDNNISLSTKIIRNDTLQANITGVVTSDFKSIDAEAVFQSFDLAVLNPILKDILYINGFATGRTLITGKPLSPIINGKLYPAFASIRVEPTQCTYYIHEKEVNVVDSEIIFDNFFAHDVRGSNFNVNTRLSHLFDGVGVKVDVRAQNIAVFRVDEVRNPNFYGNAFGTGTVNVERIGKKSTVNINATTEKGTHLIIPMVTSIDALASNNNNISFVTTQDSIKEINLNNIKTPADVQLNLNVDVNPEATIELLLNPLTQENIKGYGEGKLTVDYNGLRSNALRVFGEYRLIKGDYMFSYYKVVNKKFALNPGSKIIFNGNLEDTRLDLVASYKARTALSELLGDTTMLLRRSTPIECNINISGNIYQPTLQVNITAPNADLEIQNKMRAALHDKDIVMMQFVSLLLTNRFITNSELANSNPVATSSGTNMAALFTGELIASQVNSVLSQILPLSVDLKLSPSADGGKTDVGVSLTSELNDWLMLNGSIEYLQKSSIRNETVQGDLSLEAKIDKEGNLRVKAFTQANDNQSLYEYDSQGLNNRHGVGIFYQKEFNSLRELFERKKKEAGVEKKK